MTNEPNKTLSKLIETLRDGEQGFKTAAEKLENTNIKTKFVEFSNQRASFATELSGYVTGGEESSTQGVIASAAGAVHRGWIDIKSALGGGDQSILNEAERGEDYAVKAYKEAMAESLPASVETIINKQYATIKATHDTVKALRDGL